MCRWGEQRSSAGRLRRLSRRGLRVVRRGDVNRPSLRFGLVLRDLAMLASSEAPRGTQGAFLIRVVVVRDAERRNDSSPAPCGREMRAGERCAVDMRAQAPEAPHERSFSDSLNFSATCDSFPFRRTVIVTSSPGRFASIADRNSSTVSVGSPSTATITSADARSTSS